MAEKFLLRIDTPCHENWNGMTPDEKGRFCGSCQKTVVDFTAMSDVEVVQYLSKAGQNVCGRFEDSQLGKPLTVKPESIAARGRRVWYWLVAGLLMVTRVQGQTKGRIRVTHVIAQPPVTMGLPVVEAPKTPVDSFKTLPAVTVRGYATCTLVGRLGGVSYGVEVTKLQKVKDTLVAIGLLPRQPLQVYPSPVQRGAAVQLSWDTAAGSYKVGLYNIAGGLIFEKIMQVGQPKQVDLMEIPSGIAAGVYVIRVAGKGRPFSRKIVVM